MCLCAQTIFFCCLISRTIVSTRPSRSYFGFQPQSMRASVSSSTCGHESATSGWVLGGISSCKTFGMGNLLRGMCDVVWLGMLCVCTRYIVMYN